ncbi:MAG: DNA recombination protein RmuC [Candidatus Peribacteraceae bacterium]|nr:DNA recombination protein RmuC [Candidatus Peribacteraceae bacterium]
MEIATLIIGLLIGVIAGGTAAAYHFRKTAKDAEATAEAISAKVITQQAEQILRLAETKLSGKKELIDGSLKAVKDDLERVERLMREIGSGNTKIDTRLQSAAEVIKELSDTAGSLKNALSSNSNRGQWGERMAEDVLRLSGLIEGINYIKQKKIEAGASKPDFTFLLPQQLKLNMDVKFPFNNYQLYVEAKTEKEREDCKKAFLKDVKNRIKEVQTRDYINPQDNTVDYVLLFIPNEQIYAFINEIDRTIIDEAMKAKTILCSPLSLYAVLAVIRQSIDNFSIASKSQEMLTLFGGFKQQWEKFKDQMETVQTRFELVHKGYEELTGTRERQLDRQLQKLEELRLDTAVTPALIEETFDRVAAKKTMKAVA